MPEKKRYLIGYRDNAVVPKNIETMMDSFEAGQEGVKRIRKLRTGQSIIEMTEEQAVKLAEEQPDLIIEEDRELEMFLAMPGLMPRVPAEVELSLTFRVLDEETNKPVENVTIYCAGSGVTYKGVTDKEGIAKVRAHEAGLRHIIASPRDTYWSKVVPASIVNDSGKINITLKKISTDGNYGWGHRLLGMDKTGNRFTGRGIKIAIIDSGIAGHEDLKTAGGYNTLDGQNSEAWNIDEKGHGTHCCGIIASQDNKVGITGMAPDAEIYSLKVFPGGRFSDLVEAVNWCIDNYMDIISMSLGSRSHSAQIEQALREAGEKGITCIAAAGNDGGAVSYPAAYDNVIAVSAIGKRGSFPEDSAHKLQAGDYLSTDGELFIAGFSNSGPEIDVCAPGVAILSTVPTGYAAWDGTSMACPAVSGLAALILEAYPEIRTGDEWQPYYVREIINGSAADIGLPQEMQGAGLPKADLALCSALDGREYENEILTSYREYMEEMLERAKKQTEKIEESIKKLDTMK